MDQETKDLLKKYREYTGLSAAEVEARCVEVGIKRLAARDRNTTQAWAGKANPNYPAPGREGAGRFASAEKKEAAKKKKAAKKSKKTSEAPASA